ncbi:MAG: hypothetical protein B1H08_05960 [Candidatus Omnitrophica bacterium 4484_171]|nr:MAG: hypothetical protein B1H08_05960 [Candidatus Omnitrophica bacterium 4484_171]
MAERRIEEAVNLIKGFLERRQIKVERVVIFGSYAKGNYTKDSDIDVGIVSESFEDKDIFQKAEMLKGLNWLLVERVNLPFDIVPISLEEWRQSSSLIVEFIKEGEVLSL